MSICNLHVDWKSQGSFNFWRLKQLLSWIPLLASVEIAPFGEIYKYDRKTGKVVDGSIPLHTTFNQTLFVRLQTTFSAPAWNVRRGHLVFGSSVRLSVRPSVCTSVRLSVYPLFRPAYKQSAIFKIVVVIQLPNLDCKFIYTVYREFFASGKFGENDALQVC